MGDALKLLPLPVEKRVKLMLNALKQVYPHVDIASHIIGDPITVSWESDPNFLGAFKGALPGHYRYNHRMYCHFIRTMPPQERGIFIAGDDVSWTPGWVEGAVTTGLNARLGHPQAPGRRSPEGEPRPRRPLRRPEADGAAGLTGAFRPDCDLPSRFGIDRRTDHTLLSQGPRVWPLIFREAGPRLPPVCGSPVAFFEFRWNG